MKGALAAVTVVGTVAVAAVGAASADRAGVATPTTVEATTPAATSITNGPLTVTLVDAHYSDAASQLVVVLEITATTTLEPQAAGAVYVGPDGQQVEATDYIEPERVFVDATALSVMVFPAASPGGTVMYYALADTTRLDVSIPVMIAELAEPLGTETVPEDPPPQPTTGLTAALPTDGQPVTATTDVPAADADGDGLSDEDEAFCCDANNPDSDGDGLTDGDEMHIWNTSAGFADSDNDMLSDYDEVIEYGSNPNNRDSDGDGHIDAYEIQTETDPNDPDSDDDGDSDLREVLNQIDPNDPDINCNNKPGGCFGVTTPSTTTLALPPPPTAVAPDGSG